MLRYALIMQRSASKVLVSEHQEQVVLCKILALQYPKLLYFAIPNGGARNIISATLLKAEGVKPGVPDMFFPSLHLFVEMKRNDKTAHLSKFQKIWFEELTKLGYNCRVAYGAEHGIKIIKQYYGKYD